MGDYVPDRQAARLRLAILANDPNEVEIETTLTFLANGWREKTEQEEVEPEILVGPWTHEGVYECRVRLGADGLACLDWRLKPNKGWELGGDCSLETVMALDELVRITEHFADQGRCLYLHSEEVDDQKVRAMRGHAARERLAELGSKVLVAVKHAAALEQNFCHPVWVQIYSDGSVELREGNPGGERSSETIIKLDLGLESLLAIR